MRSATPDPSQSAADILEVDDGDLPGLGFAAFESSTDEASRTRPRLIAHSSDCRLGQLHGLP